MHPLHPYFQRIHILRIRAQLNEPFDESFEEEVQGAIGYFSEEIGENPADVYSNVNRVVEEHVGEEVEKGSVGEEGGGLEGVTCAEVGEDPAGLFADYGLLVAQEALHERVDPAFCYQVVNLCIKLEADAAKNPYACENN